MTKYEPGEVYQDGRDRLWCVNNDGTMSPLIDGHWDSASISIGSVEMFRGPLIRVSSAPQSKDDHPEDHDQVNNPKHYTSHPSGIECIQITRHENFNRGNALKYWWRAGSKQYPGKTLIESAKIDYEKAIFYIRQEVKRLEEGGGDQ